MKIASEAPMEALMLVLDESSLPTVARLIRQIGLNRGDKPNQADLSPIAGTRDYRLLLLFDDEPGPTTVVASHLNEKRQNYKKENEHEK